MEAYTGDSLPFDDDDIPETTGRTNPSSTRRVVQGLFDANPGWPHEVREIRMDSYLFEPGGSAFRAALAYVLADYAAQFGLQLGQQIAILAAMTTPGFVVFWAAMPIENAQHVRFTRAMSCEQIHRAPFLSDPKSVLIQGDSIRRHTDEAISWSKRNTEHVAIQHSADVAYRGRRCITLGYLSLVAGGISVAFTHSPLISGLWLAVSIFCMISGRKRRSEAANLRFKAYFPQIPAKTLIAPSGSWADPITVVKVYAPKHAEALDLAQRRFTQLVSAINGSLDYALIERVKKLRGNANDLIAAWRSPHAIATEDERRDLSSDLAIGLIQLGTEAEEIRCLLLANARKGFDSQRLYVERTTQTDSPLRSE